ncbi:MULTISPECIES: hypothetical protein [unclassified Spirulina]|uniref:hypothetical protein n=1 Tax=unclassified Spirulina TaxID=2684457 RepID=UPI00194FAE7D|nr:MULTISPECIES: hypothetical protein [Spirulina]MEA5471852.1 hypothetical protein [Spirulina sp. 06S082]
MSQLSLNLTQGSVSFKFTLDSANALKAEIQKLMQTLKEIASERAAGKKKPSPKANMEYRYAGDVFLEVFCNPNIYATPFAAKVLITVRDDRLRLTTEAELTQLVEDINSYLEQAV